MSNLKRRKQKSNKRRSFPVIRRPKSEIKYLDFFQVNADNFQLPTFIATSGYESELVKDTTGSGEGFIALNRVIQGTLATNRIGNHISVISIKFSMLLKVNGTAKFNSVRACLVYDKFPNGIYPLTTDIFMSVSNTASTLLFDSPKNQFNSDRFVVLDERFLDLDSDFKDQQRLVLKYRRPMKTQFKGTAGTIADISQGAIYIITGSSAHAGALGVDTSVIPTQISSRVRFIDN